MDLHDDWNLLAIGALNVLHVGWWCGLTALSPSTSILFYVDGAYLLLDSCWLLFAPSCVPAKSRLTLLVHHCLVCALLPFAASNQLFMSHLVRTWMVELHSWNHIAARRLGSSPFAGVLEAMNKPLFCALRLVGFPLTWFQFAAERAALPLATQAALTPLSVYVPLGVAHSLMYALMLKWG
mgnify:FL=1